MGEQASVELGDERGELAREPSRLLPVGCVAVPVLDA
jgi:hypothetical protein